MKNRDFSLFEGAIKTDFSLNHEDGLVRITTSTLKLNKQGNGDIHYSLERHSFIIFLKKLAAVFTNGTQYDMDLHNLMKVYFDRRLNQVVFDATWINVKCDGVSVEGKLQHFSVPADKLYELLSAATDTAFSHLYYETHCPPRIEFTKSANTKIRSLSWEEKKAFGKCLQHLMQWQRTAKITICSDYDGFSFAEFIQGGERGICGGIIPHKRTRKGKNDVEYSALSFEVHT